MRQVLLQINSNMCMISCTQIIHWPVKRMLTIDQGQEQAKQEEQPRMLLLGFGNNQPC